MKITYLSLSTIPSTAANSIHVMKMCQAFKQESHDISLVALLPQEKKSVLAGTTLWEHYGITQPFNMRLFKRFRVFKLYDYNIRSLCYAKKMNCEIAYARNLGAAAYTAEKGIPTIFECHSPILDNWRQKKEFYRLLKAPGFRRLIVITDALRKQFLENHAEYISENSIRVVPDAVDLERFLDFVEFSLARKECGVADRFTVGYAGHLYPGRGIEVIFELAQKLPHMQFLVVGGLHSDVADRCTEAKNRGLINIVFTGFVPNKILPKYLAACNVLLMPYQKTILTHGHSAKSTINTAQWASPMKMFEYMAMRRLIISSDLPVLREVLNETNSVFCDPEDIDQWSQSVKKAQDDQEWATRLSDKAFEDVQQYTWRKRVNKVLEGINV